ncbi:MAG: cytochrome c oxidase subunit 3 family protein [Bacteroidales bacterium]|nr:cytochrome c oxidase subunit 3 family protein [Bacteroidales bacterium]
MEHASGFVLPNSGHNRDAEASKMGMWLFLFTEILLFGGLFIVYMVYRMINSEAFLLSSFELNVTMGTINTVVLLVSSMTIAMSITAIQKGNTRLSVNLLFLTLAAALIFMIIKYFEWSAKIHHGLFPGMEYYENLPKGEGLFFYLYFFMTGLHALHIIIGAIIIAVVIYRTKKGLITPERYTLTENAGLYWHLVDLIWIYLFPLFYLIH